MNFIYMKSESKIVKKNEFLKNVIIKLYFLLSNINLEWLQL